MAKSPEDLAVEERIRAHIRQQMRERGIDKAELSRRLRYDDAAVGRLLKGERGSIRPGLIVRIADALKITPTRLLLEDPPREFFAEGSELPPKH